MYALLARAMLAAETAGTVLAALPAARDAAVAELRTQAYELRLSGIFAGLAGCPNILRADVAAARALDVVADLTEGR